jgi:Domain of unknown function (DUF4382)
MYPYPGWRRVIFVAVLLVVLVLTLIPSITQGTIKIHIYGLGGTGALDHLFVSFKSLQLHTFGFAFTANTGWISLNQSTAPIDLIQAPGQYLPKTVESAPITTGRYDAIRLIMTNSTAQVGTKSFSLSNTPVLDANFTLPISPNGFGDVLLLLSFDYALILQSPGTLSIRIVQTSVV